MTVERKITSRHGVDSRPLSEWLRDAWRAAANLHPSCAQRLGFPHSSIEVPHAYPIQRHCPTALRRGGRSPGGRTGRRRTTAKGGIAARRALGKLSASVRQIGIRRATSVRVKQSKSQQIVPNAYARGQTTFAMRSCLRAAKENATSLMSIETGTLSAAKRQLKNATANSSAARSSSLSPTRGRNCSTEP